MEKCEKNLNLTEILKCFFMGRYYPVFVCALVLIGYMTGTELYLNILNLGMLSVALCVCDSLRPLVAVLCTFVFQISREHTPADFSMDTVEANNYYFDGANGYIFILSFIPPAVALVVFFVKNKLISKKALASLPMLVPSAILSVALMLGGAFSGAWSGASFAYSLSMILIWFIVPYLFILGFKNEKSKDLIDYFVFLASLVVIILLSELLYVYLSTDGLITESGSIKREFLMYGWGNNNTASQALVILIPVLFIGAALGGNRHQIYYFSMATLALLGVVLNVSRSGLLVGGLAYFACAVVSFIKSSKKKRFLIETGIVLAGIAVIVVASRNVIFSALQDYIDRGVSDTGRFRLWGEAFEAFKESPVFGKGFFGLYSKDHTDVARMSTVAFLPDMAHNTFFQLIGSLGVVGLLAYGFYRVCSLRPFIRKPSYMKIMIGAAMLTVLGGSLVDNFVFYMLPMFNYAVLFAILYKIVEEEGDNKRSLF